ncbi:MAG: GTP-binding protein [Myxococcales bacterium]|nr:GTP-binding protein [Myxococcales bacterium]
MADPRLPVTLVAGFLGAGKTTVLNRLLASPNVGRVAVIVNEAGEVALDGRLIIGTTEEIVEIRDGCVCCTVRGDLRVAVGRLLDRRAAWFRPLRFDRILVECSGLASPGPVVQTFRLDPRLAAETRVDGVVVVASAVDLPTQLAGHPEAAEQVAYADRIIVNHCDRAGPASGLDDDPVAAAVRAIREINPGAPIDRAVRGETATAPLLDLGGEDVGRWTTAFIRPAPAQLHGLGLTRHVVLRTTSTLNLPALKLYLQFVASRRTWTLMRLKGILRCEGLSRGVVAHGVYQWLELGPGPMDPPDESQLLLIGRNLDLGELQRGWAAVSTPSNG